MKHLILPENLTNVQITNICYSVDDSYESQTPQEKENSELKVKQVYNALKKEVVSKKKFIVIELNPFNMDLTEVTTEQLQAELQKRELINQ